MRTQNWAMLLLSIVYFSAHGAWAETPDPAENIDIGPMHLAAIEYWYHDPDGTMKDDALSFGFKSDKNPSARECARKAYQALKEIISKRGNELKLMRDAGGPKTIYLIISDMSKRTDERIGTAYTWQYHGDERTHRGGLMKFHGYSNQEQCSVPTEDDVVQYALDVRQAITISAAGRAESSVSTNQIRLHLERDEPFDLQSPAQNTTPMSYPTR